MWASQQYARVRGGFINLCLFLSAMAFQDIPPIELPNAYLDAAIKQGKKKAAAVRETAKGAWLQRVRFIELESVKTIHRYLKKRLTKVLEMFPNLNELNPFYHALVKIQLDYVAVKQALGHVNSAIKRLDAFAKEYVPKIQKAMDQSQVSALKKQYLGRTSSLVKKLQKSLQILEQARRVLVAFPVIKENLFTVCIFGFPNVGKTTLLFKLTGSKPDIQPYAFTTKRLNVGYLKADSEKIQVMDTPGTLNRFERMNKYEQEAWLALEHCAAAVVYVFDLTEPYPLQDQKKLLQRLEHLKKTVYCTLSKRDLLSGEQIRAFSKQQKLHTVEELRELLVKGAETLQSE